MYKKPKWMDPDYDILQDHEVEGFDGFFYPIALVPLRVLSLVAGIGLGLVILGGILPILLNCFPF